MKPSQSGSVLTDVLQPYEKAFEQNLDLLLELGFIEGSTFPWDSPAFPVLKTKSSIRFVIDYHRLNLVSPPDPYSMPRIEVVLERMSRTYIFSTVDLAKGFYHVPLHSPHIPKTAFIPEHGKFHFSVMPFGLRNTPSIFQRLMDVVLKKDRAFSCCYIDDISVFQRRLARTSTSYQNHPI